MENFYLSPEQVASRLQLDVETVRRLLRKKELIGVHVSRKCWRIAESDLEVFIKNRK